MDVKSESKEREYLLKIPPQNFNQRVIKLNDRRVKKQALLRRSKSKKLCAC
jgi:hypothetical protein